MSENNVFRLQVRIYEEEDDDIIRDLIHLSPAVRTRRIKKLLRVGLAALSQNHDCANSPVARYTGGSPHLGRSTEIGAADGTHQQPSENSAFNDHLDIFDAIGDPSQFKYGQETSN